MSILGVLYAQSAPPEVITQDQAGCTFSLQTQSTTLSASGGSGTVELAGSASACSWTSASSAPWTQVYPLSGTGSSSVQYTVYPNFSTSQRTATLNIAGQLFTITQAANTATRDQRFIQLVYFNFLGRLPSPTELASQAPQVQFKGYTDFVMSFYNTPEFNLGGRFIAGLYRGLLGRDAEYNGWLFQRNALATGIVTQDKLVENFIGGAEFDQRFREQYPNSSVTDIQASASDFIRYLYVNILGRTPGTTEVNGHLPSLLTGGKVAKARTF